LSSLKNEFSAYIATAFFFMRGTHRIQALHTDPPRYSKEEDTPSLLLKHQSGYIIFIFYKILVIATIVLTIN